MRRLFVAVCVFALTSVGQSNVARADENGAAAVPSPSAGAPTDAKFILTLSACSRRRTSEGGTVCVPLNNARLEARLREQASTSNFHEAVFDPGTTAAAATAAASSATTADTPSADAKQTQIQQTGVETYREGFDLTVKPLYESDEALYAQYDIVSEQVTGWEYSASPGEAARHRPVVQRTHVFGTTRLRVGESVTLERNGYSFVLSYARKGGAVHAGEL